MLSFFSIRAAHAAQVIPRIDSSILRIAESLPPTSGIADTFRT
jgi:hypothetical protein